MQYYVRIADGSDRSNPSRNSPRYSEDGNANRNDYASHYSKHAHPRQSKHWTCQKLGFAELRPITLLAAYLGCGTPAICKMLPMCLVTIAT